MSRNTISIQNILIIEVFEYKFLSTCVDEKYVKFAIKRYANHKFFFAWFHRNPLLCYLVSIARRLPHQLRNALT